MWTGLDAKDDNRCIVLNKVCLIFEVSTNLYNSCAMAQDLSNFWGLYNSDQWLKICLIFEVLINLYNSGQWLFPQIGAATKRVKLWCTLKTIGTSFATVTKPLQSCTCCSSLCNITNFDEKKLCVCVSVAPLPWLDFLAIQSPASLAVFVCVYCRHVLSVENYMHCWLCWALSTCNLSVWFPKCVVVSCTI